MLKHQNLRIEFHIFLATTPDASERRTFVFAPRKTYLRLAPRESTGASGQRSACRIPTQGVAALGGFALGVFTGGEVVAMAAFRGAAVN